MAIVAVLIVGVRAMSLTAPALAEHEPVRRSAEAQVERSIVPSTPTAASDGLPVPILVGGIVLAFAVGLTAGQVHRRRRATVRSRTAAARPARVVATPPARPAPPPPEPGAPPARKPLGIASAAAPPATRPAPPPPPTRPAPPRVVQPPPAPVKPPPEPMPEPPRVEGPAPEPPAVEEPAPAAEPPKPRRRAKPKAKRRATKAAKRKAAKPPSEPELQADEPRDAQPTEEPAPAKPARRSRAKRAVKPAKAKPGRSRASQPRAKPRRRAKPAATSQPAEDAPPDLAPPQPAPSKPAPATDVPVDRAPPEPAPPKPAAAVPFRRTPAPTSPSTDVQLEHAPEIPRAEGPADVADPTAPLDLAPEALRGPQPAPPSEHEAAVPARRFARATPWPEDAEQLWTCEIDWKAGYRKSVFRAMAGAPGWRKPEPLGEAPPVGWMLMGDPEPPTPELAVRVRALMNALEAAGWEHIGRGVSWYAQRFVWRGPGEPGPIVVEDVVEAGEPPQA